MPIETQMPVSAISDAEFYKIDERMLGHAFAIHNQFGRLLDEVVYKAELAERCEKDGMPAQREARVRVRHREFTKDYFLDLVLCGSTIIEVKTVKETLKAHAGQGLNYLLLTGARHGSLVNFRPPRVTRRFLSSRLTLEKRRQFAVKECSWPDDEAHATLRQCVIELCSDVGLGLDLLLYREGVALLAGGVREMVPLRSETKVVGHHEMTLLRADVGLAITAVNKMAEFRRHLSRLLSMTELSGIAWVNLELGSIQFEGVKR